MSNTKSTPNIVRNPSLLQHYKKSLTSFGAARVRDGRPLEKILWTIAMMIIVSFTSYTIYGNAVRYLAYGVRTETIEKENLTLPVVTFCLESTLYSHSDCYNNKTLYGNTTCNVTSASASEMWYYHDHLGLGRKAKDLGGDCHVFNENGTIEGFQKIEFVANSTINDSLLVIFQSLDEFTHRKENTYITTAHETLLLKPSHYRIFINEQHTSRLPSPYSSNCTDGNLISNTFSDRHTYNSCKETCLYSWPS